MTRGLRHTSLHLNFWAPILAATLGICAVTQVISSGFAQETEPGVSFEKQIWPIFQNQCVDCHGANTAEGQLRLDAAESFFGGGVNGSLVNRDRPSESLLLQRIQGHGDADQMPLDAPPLTDATIRMIHRWIEEGAIWPEGLGENIEPRATHWAYAPPQRSVPPTSTDDAWSQHPIDTWILQAMSRQQLRPEPAAELGKLVRRMHLDLTGLPPSAETIEEFLADPRPDAIERELDRLLASPHYGQRWARPWLDMARYADSNGYQADQYREVWPYRDWVVNAINSDMPFDQFTIEQLAGDLLENPTVENRIATGFHRLTTCNVEAGVDPEENRVNQVLDRVNTTATVWLGTTLECCQCHSHKYDPFNQREYYQLFAYFNNTPLEVKDSGNNIQYEFIGPRMELPLSSEVQMQRTHLQATIKQEQSAITELRNSLLENYRNELATVSESVSESEATAEGTDPENSPPAPLETKSETAETKVADTKIPDDLKPLIAKPFEKLNAGQKNKVTAFLTTHHADLKAKIEKLKVTQQSLTALDPNTTLVMIEQPETRETRVFKRGDFLNPGEVVRPGTPQVLHLQLNSRPPNRLGLAQWLVDPENPLTPRVMVNRWWGEIFGRPLVTTTEDFGTQGERPTHPEVLDWMAMEWVRSGWSMKSVHRQLLLSATYRQSSSADPAQIQVDPLNQWLARGGRFRLSAETLRDNALAISGVLTSQLGGPPVYPPQPPNVWRHVGRNAPVYKTSEGAERYRRGLYVFWRRSAPYPSFVNFDAPDRASCTVNRARTNTPLQALTLLNDTAYLELAGHLANQVLNRHSSLADSQRLAATFRQCVAREPTDNELLILQEHLDSQRNYYSAHLEEARKLSRQKLLENTSQVEFAAWMVVASTLLNLDETLCRD